MAAATPLLAEAIACQQALMFASDQGMMSFELESDCLGLKVALTSSAMDAAEGGALFKDIKFLIMCLLQHRCQVHTHLHLSNLLVTCISCAFSLIFLDRLITRFNNTYVSIFVMV